MSLHPCALALSIDFGYNHPFAAGAMAYRLMSDVGELVGVELWVEEREPLRGRGLERLQLQLVVRRPDMLHPPRTAPLPVHCTI